MSASFASLTNRWSVLCSLRLSPPVPRSLPGTTHRGRCPAGGRWMSQTGENLRPLEGVRVLDLTRVLAGPFATMILGDLGAEVIKVERPGAGDDTRVWGPPFISSESVYFLSVNRNKKSIAVDLKHPRGAKIIKEVSCLSHIAANYLNAGKEARRWGTAHESIVPYQGFETKDGHIVVAAGNDKQFVKVCEVLELIELNEDQRYKTNKLRVQNRKELLHTLSQRFLQKNTADWLRSFEGSGVPVGPINSIQEVFSDPQVKHNDLIQEMNHPTAGRISVPGPAVRFSSFTPGGPTPPPLIGQHTVQVLRDTLSYSDDIIKVLLECKAVVQNKVF
ncbi:succinate--hydroxymethylglutarate CoA-transferase isoform X4 [Hippoglossus stenolepis]|uniref:succinate--hydroxymethylglutarate CoA-transferase isoform X4 n=1 Tax=Hippoglossus stenolepis TaxID=195615 RepID=UPI001FAEA750|nr:succinate--hydroxymethylglutarate CoA-transferase isoform X4 [Hippoglossus stenolepis]